MSSLKPLGYNLRSTTANSDSHIARMCSPQTTQASNEKKIDGLSKENLPLSYGELRDCLKKRNICSLKWKNGEEGYYVGVPLAVLASAATYLAFRYVFDNSAIAGFSSVGAAISAGIFGPQHLNAFLGKKESQVKMDAYLKSFKDKSNQEPISDEDLVACFFKLNEEERPYDLLNRCSVSQLNLLYNNAVIEEIPEIYCNIFSTIELLTDPTFILNQGETVDLTLSKETVELNDRTKESIDSVSQKIESVIVAVHSLKDGNACLHPSHPREFLEFFRKELSNKKLLTTELAAQLEEIHKTL